MKNLKTDPMYMDLAGKTVVVTGGSSGIGKATVERFIREGCTVYNLDVSPPTNNFSGYIECDVSSSDDVKKSLKKIGDQENSIDAVISNAGVEHYYYEHDIPEEKWDQIIGVDLKGAFLITKYSVPYLLKSDYPSIAYTASVQSFMVQQKDTAYVTAKHGVLGLMRSVAVNYAPKIRSNAVCPGPIITPLQIREAKEEVGDDDKKIQAKLDEWGRMTPMKRQGLPQEVANVFAFLAAREASYISGASILVDGAMSVYIPESVPGVQRR
ncbi:MAG: SDR family oxidoreductase [Candidatus Thermoplasmatota archaeon]|nr:SDR family oxidoreductase [Candidatus Thermoplasmatota archaeon]